MKKITWFGSIAVLALVLAPLVYAADKDLPWHLEKSSKLIGWDVENSRGEKIGDIEEVVVDPAHNRIAYTVISTGGFLGMGERWVAVPLSALKRSDKDANVFILDVDKERLKNAPGFDKDKWPEAADRSWVTTVYSFYNQPTYWNLGERTITATVADTKGTLKLKTADGRTTELAVPDKMLEGLQAGDRVEVTIREK
jgi:sporulation protein YlmC with PRC-barrel domain